MIRIEVRLCKDERTVSIECDDWHPEADLVPWTAMFGNAIESIDFSPKGASGA